MERAIIKDNDENYYFFDDPEWGVDVERNEVELVLDIVENVLAQKYVEGADYFLMVA